jgi:hypothetical protein
LLHPDTNLPVFLPGVSHFCGIQDGFYNQARLKRFTDWASARRIRLLRQFCMLNGGAGVFLDAANNPNFLPMLKDHAQHMQDLGFWLEVVAFADHQTDELKGVPLSFLDRIDETLDGMGHLISGVNEHFKNGVNPALLNRPSRHVASHASCGTDAQPWWTTPEWDHEIFEGSREDDFERRYKDGRDQFMGDNANDDFPAHAFLCPLIMNEMIGIGPIPEPGRTTNNPYKVWTFCAGLKMMGFSGLVGHLRTGIFGDPPVEGDPADQCMEALVDAAELPLGENAFGGYQRGNAPYDEHGNPIGQNPNLPIEHHDIEPGDFPGGIHYPGDPKGSLRTHSMSDGVTWQVCAPGAGPGYEYLQHPKPGWKLLNSFGWGSNPKNVGIFGKA